MADEVVDWDFFVSYTQADCSWAEWIAWILEENDYRVLVQAWDFVPGTNWTQRMQDGTVRAARTLAVLSDDYLKSVYGKPEWLAAWQQDPDGAKRKLIPIRVADCDRPGLLAAVTGFDLFGRPEAQARARLLEGVAGATSGRAKPQSKPGFPGAGRAISTAARFPGTLPSIWRVDPRNPNFTGRDDELTAMKTSLTADSTVTVHSVSGLGGVGKTRLAIEYAHKFAGDYDVVWWIPAETPASIPDHFAALAGKLGLAPTDSPEELRAAVHDALRTAGGWLLIFDNADNVDDIGPWLPSGPLSAGTPGHVIVTTRRRGFRRLGTVLDLDVIDMDAAVRLLQTRAPELDDADAESIAHVLGRLPLSLEQAAAYLDRTQIPPREYLDLLTTRQSTLLTGTAGQLRDRSVATVWELSLDRIRDDDPAGLQLLDICAYLAPEPIPLDLFSSHPDALPEPLSTAAADPLLFNNVIATVVDCSMVKRSPSGLQLHRLVQAAIRTRHPKLAGSTRDLPGPAAAAMSEPAPSPVAQQHPLGTALAVLGAAAPPGDTSAPQHWPRWAVLLPHVLAAANLFEDTADTDAALATSWLLDRAGSYLQTQGRPRQARPLLERALAIAETAYGPEHPRVNSVLHNLALILRDLGDFAAARPLAERALTIAETAYGPEHPNVGTALNNLAIIVRDLGDPAAARPLAERALTIAETAYGPEHPGPALNTLALILDDLGDLAAARPLAERALTIAETAYGPEHPNVDTALNNLALILRGLGDFAAARPLAERALTIAEPAYGPEHPEVGTDLTTLAMIVRDLGDFAAARPLAERALTIAETAYGPEHPTVGIRLHNLAMIVCDLGDFAAARPLAERALAIAETAYGPDDPTVGALRGNLVAIVRELERPGSE